MALLTCSFCSVQQAESPICVNCGHSLAEPDSLVRAPAAADAEKPDGSPSCLEPSCPAPAARGSLRCPEHAILHRSRRTEEHRRALMDNRDFELVAVQGWRVRIAANESVIVGRESPDERVAGLLSSSRYVSGRHASFTSRSGVLTVRDLASRNGTHVQDRRIPPQTDVTLVPGDKVTLGRQVVFYVAG